MRRSVLGTSPWRHAWFELRRRPSLALAALLVGGVVGLVAAAPVLFVAAAGAGAVQVQWRDACPASVAPTLDAARALPIPGQPPTEADATFSRLVAAIDGDASFGEPEHIVANYSANPVTLGEREGSIGFITRPDFLDHVDLVGAQGDGDVWLPDTLATQLEAAAGDVITVRLPYGEATLTVAGVVRDPAQRTLDQYWCAANRALVPQNMFGEIFPPPMAMVTAETFASKFLDGSLHFSRYSAPFAAPPRTIADAHRLRAATDAFRDRAEALEPADRVSAGIDRLERRAVSVRDAVRDTTLPVALLALACALASAAVLGALWMRVRRTTGIALATIGIPPAAVGAKAAAEVLIAVMVGGVAGAGAARVSMGAWAPSSTLEPGTMRTAVMVAIGAALVAVAIAGVAAGVASRTLLRVAAPPRRRTIRFVPVELVFVGVAWWASHDLRRSVLLDVDTSRVTDTSSSVLLLPLALLALGAMLTARAWGWVTARPRSTTLGSRLATRLAVRRLQFGSRTGSAILGAGTLALGVSVFGLAMNTSLARTGDAKAAVFVGGETSLLIAASLPAGTPDASEVWIRKEMEYAGEPIDVVALDPASFAAVAFWDDAFADRSLPDLLAALSTPVDGVAAVLVGDGPSAGALRNPKNDIGTADVVVVGTARAFPGAGRDRPTLVTSIAAMADGPINFRHYVWANGTYPEWRTRLQQLGAQPLLGIDRQDAIDGSVLEFAAWSFDFVRALGVFVGILVIVALTLQLAARQRQHALAAAFLRRMGMGTRRHWGSLVLETAVVAGVMVVLGVSLALVSARVVSPYVDPLPTLLPDPLSVVPWTSLVVVVALSALVVVGGTAAAQAAGSRVDVAEVLRDGT